MKETVYLLVPVKVEYSTQAAKRLAIKGEAALTQGLTAGHVSGKGFAKAQTLRGRWLKNNIHLPQLLGSSECKKQ